MMKRFHSDIIILLAVTLLSAGCAKEMPVLESGDTKYIDAADSPAPEDFFCSYEGLDTKTGINGDNEVIWTGGEKVLINDGTASNNAIYTAQASGTSSTKLTKTSGSITATGSYYAVYPGDATGASASNGTYTTVIPATQAYSATGHIANGALPMVGTGGADGTITFKNAAGVLHFKPRLYDVNEPKFTESGKKIYGITITANENIAGTVTISYTAGGTPTTAITSGGTNTITITCSNVDFGSDFYVVMPAGTYTGVTATLTTKTDKGNDTLTKVPLGDSEKGTATSGTLTIERNTVTNLGAVEFYGTGLFYVTDLGKTATANSYIVKGSNSWYKIPLGTRGNGTATLGSQSSYHNIPSTFNPADIKYIYVYYVCGNEMFEVKPFLNAAGNSLLFKTAGDLQQGSALVAVCSDAWDGDPTKTMNALWSWHIWAVPGDVGSQTIGDYTWMDRNLGARQGAYCTDNSDDLGNGFFYQWGRKDPFMAKYTPTVSVDYIYNPNDSKCGPASFGYEGFSSYYTKNWGAAAKTVAQPQKLFGGSYSTSSVDYNYDWMAETLKNNKAHTGISYFDWWSTGETESLSAATLYGRSKADDTGTHKKTMFDPCPPGWRVPTVRALYNLYNGRTVTGANNTVSVTASSVVAKFPVSGLRRPGVENKGTYGYIWSANGVQATNTIGGTAITTDNFAHVMYVNATASTKLGIQSHRRGYAMPVRCIKED